MELRIEVTLVSESQRNLQRHLLAWPSSIKQFSSFWKQQFLIKRLLNIVQGQTRAYKFILFYCLYSMVVKIEYSAFSHGN